MRLRRRRRCEICNWPGHRPRVCPMLNHRMYAGLIYGMVHADPELEALYRANWFHPESLEAMVELEERMAPIREWAASKVAGHLAWKEPEW